jgi:hypothetical protein
VLETNLYGTVLSINLSSAFKVGWECLFLEPEPFYKIIAVAVKNLDMIIFNLLICEMDNVVYYRAVHITDLDTSKPIQKAA